MAINIERFISNACSNSCQSFYDIYVEANVRFRSKLGMKAVIIRRQLGHCCDWCASLAGIYDPSNAPDDIYRRHSNCRCLVTFKTENGYQDVWNKKAFQTQRIARIEKMTAVAEASAVPERFSIYKPKTRYERLRMIARGIAEEKPIFVDHEENLYLYSQHLIKENNYYDVVLHGTPDGYGAKFFGNNIDPDTLCAIIAQRKDYKKGTNIRLISCYTGIKQDGFAKYISEKMKVTVKAPNTTTQVYLMSDGSSIAVPESRVNKRDGSWITFEYRKDGKK